MQLVELVPANTSASSARYEVRLGAASVEFSTTSSPRRCDGLSSSPSAISGGALRQDALCDRRRVTGSPHEP